MSLPTRTKASLLTVSAAALAATLAYEGFSSKPYIPTKGDVPTIGYGTTVYPDGTKVKLTDPPISRKKAAEYASAHVSQEELAFRASIADVPLTQDEYDLYLDFVYQYGMGWWLVSSMRKNLLAVLKTTDEAAQNALYRAACEALLLYKRQAGRDCSNPNNWGTQGCKGVWTRQQERRQKCLKTGGFAP
ncbi:MAG: hypothetical protein LBL69_03770 [Zoogloeaceae bacterium]|jgi:GH24 family phage-related lysozyme (muramidase)|nr:hypothetical protein [Zoogloeaceae bacterium]